MGTKLIEGGPAPVPADLDLRDFPYMPLLVQRLRDSDLAAKATDFVFRHSVLSWGIAWHQVPAGSLPDDDSVLAMLFSYGRDDRGVKNWLKARAKGALYGWVKCADGRLYHAVVCEVAHDTYIKRKSAASSGRLGAEKRWENNGIAPKPPKGGPKGPADSHRNSHSQQPTPLAGGNRVGDGNEEKEEKEEKESLRGGKIGGPIGGPRTPEPDRLPDAKAMWPAKRWTGEVRIRNLWTFAIPKAGGQQALLDGIAAYLASVDRGPPGDEGKFCKSFDEWLDAERWTERLPASATPLRALTSSPADAATRMRPRRVRDLARGFAKSWKSDWGEPPTRGDVMAAEVEFLTHVLEVDEGRAPWDKPRFGDNRPTHSEILRARAWRDRQQGGGDAKPEARA